jgi:hypothetical protein
MKTKQSRPQQPVATSKKVAEVSSKQQPARSVPATLDEKALRAVGGGTSNSAPHGVW